MRRLHAFVIALLLSFGTSLCGFAEPASDERAKTSTDAGWIRLFDGKSLHGWYTYLERQKKNEDPANVFQVHDGVIHVYKDQAEGGDVAIGYLATDSEYAYYHLRLEYKWGDKKFPPRAQQRRDAGLLYHAVGSDTVWPRCIECQIQENDVGDCFTVRGTQVVTSLEAGSGRNKTFHYKPEPDGGVPQTVGDIYNARISTVRLKVE